MTRQRPALRCRRQLGASADFPEKAEARQRLALLAIDGETANSTARADLDNFLRERPNDPAALLRLAQMQLRDSAADRAVKTLETIVTNNPLYRPALRQLALLYGTQLTDDPRAYELVQKARHAYPEDADLTKTLGIFAYRRQLFSQSAQLLEVAARTRPDDAELLYYLGATHQQLKHWKPCMAALERALNVQRFVRNRGKSQASTRRLHRGSHTVTVGNSPTTVIHRSPGKLILSKKWRLTPPTELGSSHTVSSPVVGCLKGFVADHACRYFFAPCGHFDKVIPMACVAGCSGAVVRLLGSEPRVRGGTLEGPDIGNVKFTLATLEVRRTPAGAGLFILAISTITPASAASLGIPSSVQAWCVETGQTFLLIQPTRSICCARGPLKSRWFDQLRCAVAQGHSGRRAIYLRVQWFWSRLWGICSLGD